MGKRLPKRDRHLISVEATVDVEVAELLTDAGDEQIRAEYEERFGAPGMPAFDLVEEVRNELVGGRVAAALALCEAHLVAARVSDDQRQAAYQAAGRAH